MRRLLVIAAVLGATLWVGVAPATAHSLARGDDEGEVAKKKRHRDGGTRDDEEKEEDFRRALPTF
ncbi:MAG: hypothetical protein IPJ65_05105 [Archangiaceae bacterium]|nr:hypothetical protein [Archangiaceae bacterium]